MIQSGGFLGRLLGPLLRTGLPLMKGVIKPLAKSVLVPSGLTAAASAADAGIHKKILGSGHNNNTTLIISNDEMDGILEILKSLKDSRVLLKGVSETVQNEAKEQRGRFLSMLLGTLGASLLGDLLTKKLCSKGVIRAGEGIIRAGYGSKLNSIEGKVSEALINNEISHEDFMVIINEEKNYRELKESIRMMNSQRSDSEKISVIEEGKKNRH